MNTIYWIHLVFSQKSDFLNRGYFYSNCAYSSSRHPFEIKLLEEFWKEFPLRTKLKFVDAFIIRTSCQNIGWKVITFMLIQIWASTQENFGTRWSSRSAISSSLCPLEVALEPCLPCRDYLSRSITKFNKVACAPSEDSCPKWILNRDLALAMEIIQDHKLSFPATVLTWIRSFNIW